MPHPPDQQWGMFRLSPFAATDLYGCPEDWATDSWDEEWFCSNNPYLSWDMQIRCDARNSTTMAQRQFGSIAAPLAEPTPAQTFMPGAWKAAVDALRNTNRPECAKLFNLDGVQLPGGGGRSLDVADMLTGAIWGQGASPGFGIGYGDIAGATVTSSGTFVVGALTETRRNSYDILGTTMTITTVSVTINTNDSSPWMSASATDQDRAVILLHELGHAFNSLRSSLGGSSIHSDTTILDPTQVRTNMSNDALIKQACF